MKSTEESLRQYNVPLSEAFKAANIEYPSISIDEKIMAGAPCVGHTRIPVYIVLDAIEGYVDLDAVVASHPCLTVQQIRDAIGFAKAVVECALNRQAPTRKR